MVSALVQLCPTDRTRVQIPVGASRPLFPDANDATALEFSQAARSTSSARMRPAPDSEAVEPLSIANRGCRPALPLANRPARDRTTIAFANFPQTSARILPACRRPEVGNAGRTSTRAFVRSRDRKFLGLRPIRNPSAAY